MTRDQAATQTNNIRAPMLIVTKYLIDNLSSPVPEIMKQQARDSRLVRESMRNLGVFRKERFYNLRAYTL
jgi:hypothetical protein